MLGWQWGWPWELWRQPGTVYLSVSLSTLPFQAFLLPIFSLLFHICQMPPLSLWLSLAYYSPSIRSYPVSLSKWPWKRKAYKMQNDLTWSKTLYRVVKICPLCALRKNHSNSTWRVKKGEKNSYTVGKVLFKIFFPHSGSNFQTSLCIMIIQEFNKTDWIHCPQSFRFSRSGVRLKNLNF